MGKVAGLGCGANPDLAIDARDVALHRWFGHPQPPRTFAIGHARSNQAERVDFARRQTRIRRAYGRRLRQRPADGR